MAKNPMRTTGDIRRLLAETMADIRSGEISVEQGNAIASLGKTLNDSMAVEIKMIRTNTELMQIGKQMAEFTHLGKTVIDDAPFVPTDGNSRLEHKPQFEPQDK